MRYRWDLGFLPASPVAATVLAAIVLVPVMVLSFRRRWRLAAARAEEVHRLMRLAAEETARIEFESVLVCAPEPTLKARVVEEDVRPCCAVCHSPTTTRCSRCKAVRYCSGKCQILHWRRGHKDECRPPESDDHIKGTSSFNNLKGVRTEQPDLCQSGFEIGRKLHVKQVEGSLDTPSSESNFHPEFVSKDNNREVNPVVDAPLKDHTSDFSANLSTSSCSSFSSCVEESLDASPNGGTASSPDISPDRLRTEVEVTIHKLEEVDCSSSVPIGSLPSGKCVDADPEDPNQCQETGSDSIEVPSCSELCEEGHGHLTTSAFDKSNPIFTKGGNNILLEKRGTSQPSGPFLDRVPSGGGGYSVSGDPYYMHNEPESGTKVSEVIASNGLSNIKTTVKGVVQKFKASTNMRHCPSSSKGDLSEKYKILFPYDLFIKLYNCNKVKLSPCGFINCGNSCYANAVLQCLAFTQPLAAYLLQGFHTKTCLNRDWCFTCEFERLLMKAKQGQSPVSPMGILSKLNQIGNHLGFGREEDAHEFLRYAIDTMQSVCLKEAGDNAAALFAEETTLIQLLFGGYLISKIKCMRCGGKTKQRERMMDLTVEIDGNIGTLEEALAKFTATEILDEENKYKCVRCNSYERAKKALAVLEAPNILTIALKRFQYGEFGKLNKAVRFPEYLDLAPYMAGTDDKFPVYSLYAVVVHKDRMNAAFSGHYICYVKSTQKWYKMDDSQVKPVEIEKVLSKNAYMLFYSRCSPRAPSVMSHRVTHEHLKNRRVVSKEGTVHRGTRDRSHDDPFDVRFVPVKAMDSWSDDGSSLLSNCSDEGSWATESTRNSISTDDFSGYLFGGEQRSLSWSSFGFSEDPEAEAEAGADISRSNSSTSSYRDAGPSKGLSYASSGRDEFLQGYFLNSDTTDQYSKVTGNGGCIEGGGINTYEGKSSVLMKRSTTRQRIAQTYY